MNATFVDTSFFLALTSPKDDLYARAIGWQRVLRTPFLTSEFVLLEVADGFAARNGSSVAKNLIDALRNHSGTQILFADSSWVARGYELFCRRLDKNWSLTDCISFEIMREFNVTDALTHDHHFQQAGFRALLREDPPNN